MIIKKRETSSEDLCKDFPHEFYEYVDYTRNLEYEQRIREINKK